MHQNASKCMHNELCKGFVHKIIKELVFITFKGAKINEIHFPLYGGTPCMKFLLHFQAIFKIMPALWHKIKLFV